MHLSQTNCIMLAISNIHLSRVLTSSQLNYDLLVFLFVLLDTSATGEKLIKQGSFFLHVCMCYLLKKWLFLNQDEPSSCLGKALELYFAYMYMGGSQKYRKGGRKARGSKITDNTMDPDVSLVLKALVGREASNILVPFEVLIPFPVSCVVTVPHTVAMVIASSTSVSAGPTVIHVCQPQSHTMFCPLLALHCCINHL